MKTIFNLAELQISVFYEDPFIEGLIPLLQTNSVPYLHLTRHGVLYLAVFQPYIVQALMLLHKRWLADKTVCVPRGVLIQDDDWYVEWCAGFWELRETFQFQPKSPLEPPYIIAVTGSTDA